MKNFLTYFILFVIIVAFGACTVTEFQPAIPYGGRAVMISVKPTNDNEIMVASETGGLFRSTDAGVKWKHILTPTIGYNDIKYLTWNPDVIIATAYEDSRVVSGGGIWRSGDSGQTWTKIVLTDTTRECVGEAHCLAIDAVSRRIWVGIKCGLAFSDDDGANWTVVKPGGFSRRAGSIVAFGGNKVRGVFEDGVWFTDDAGATWNRQPSTGLPPTYIMNVGAPNALAVSPMNPEHLFWSFYYWREEGWHLAIYFSPSRTAAWQEIVDYAGINRPVFVRTALSVRGASNQYDIYFGTGGGLKKLTVTHPRIGSPTFGTTWSDLVLDHADPADIAFKNDRKTPWLLATDGGLHKTENLGNNWTFTGGGTNGYNALQITEVTGQHYSTSRLDLYFGTQDNSIWGSMDGGRTWPNARCCEGFFLKVPYMDAGVNNKITGVACAGCGNFMDDAGLAVLRGFPNPPNDAGNPLLLKPGAYIQNTRITGTDVNLFQLTTNQGINWELKFGIPEQLMDLGSTSKGSTASPVIYIPVKRTGSTPDGNEIITLKKISDVYSRTPVVTDVNNFGSLGIFPTMFAWYKPFGINIHDPNHLIVPDILSNTMKFSRDGGSSWQIDTMLTRLITKNGVLRFRNGPFVQCHSIAFDPNNTNHIVVGTHQAGVIRSFDNGQTWEVVENTEQITDISSFFFIKEGCVVVSTYGRGLWKLCYDIPSTKIKIPEIERALAWPLIKDPSSGVWIPLKDLGDPEICPACIFSVIKGGNVTRARYQNRKLLSLSISDGDVQSFNVDGKQVDTQMKFTKNDESDSKWLSSLGIDENSKAKVKGWVTQNDEFKGLIISDNDVNYSMSQPKPQIDTYHFMGSEGGTTLTGFRAGEGIKIYGKNISNNKKLLYNMKMDGKPVDTKFISFKKDEKGNEYCLLNLPLMVGSHKFEIEQMVDNKLVKDVNYIRITVSDYDNDNKKEKKN